MEFKTVDEAIEHIKKLEGEKTTLQTSLDSLKIDIEKKDSTISQLEKDKVDLYLQIPKKDDKPPTDDKKVKSLDDLALEML